MCICDLDSCCPGLYIVVPVYIPSSHVRKSLFSDSFTNRVVFELCSSASLVCDKEVHFWIMSVLEFLFIYLRTCFISFSVNTVSFCLFLNSVIVVFSPLSRRFLYIHDRNWKYLECVICLPDLCIVYVTVESYLISM